MKIVIPGGKGQIGDVLVRGLMAAGHDVVVLSRTPGGACCRVVVWDGETAGDWMGEIDGADVLINMAGESVNCRYHTRNRRLIKDSRSKSTSVLIDAVQRAQRPPRVWLQSSTATIYAHRFDAPNDEQTGLLGVDPEAPDTWHFSYDVASSWERVFQEAEIPRTRKVLLRTAIALVPTHAGAFQILLRLVRWGLGGAHGNGRQYVSWIHDQDLMRGVTWLIEHPELDGAVNLASPHPLPNADFMRTLREAWGIGWGLPAPTTLLEVGAFFIRTETELMLKSRRVIPTRLLESGFEFRFPQWKEAAADLCRRWREPAKS